MHLCLLFNIFVLYVTHSYKGKKVLLLYTSLIYTQANAELVLGMGTMWAHFVGALLGVDSLF